jgi:predicted DNA-binding transcriptional regulator YafY
VAPQRKVERLLNLVICLLNVQRPITAAQIHDTVAGYPDGDEAFARMFERDKAELRELGIPITVEGLSSWDDEVGYRIRPGDYALPDIDLEPDEAAALTLAARLWQQASLGGAATDALLKLRAAGVETGDTTRAGVEVHISTSEPAFGALWEAVRERRPVRFDYQTPGSPAPTTRVVEPWGLVSWHGRWYVGGYDRDRAAGRVFRLDRIHGSVTVQGNPGDVSPPGDVDVREMVAGSASAELTRVARIRVRTGAGVGLRRRASSVRSDGDGHDLIEVPFTNADVLADEVAEYGADADVVDPLDVRAAIIGRLRALVEAGA